MRTTLLKACVVVAAIVTPTGLASAQQLQKISIGLSSSSIPAAGPRIAKEMGLFEKHGLNATVIPMDSGSISTMGLLSGSLNFSASATTDVVVSNARGQDLVALCTIYSGFAGVLVLSKSVVEKLGVSPTAPLVDRYKALNGLLIASPSPTSVYTLATKPTAEAGGGSVRFSYMAQPAMVAALETGAIQGYVASAPFYTQSVMKGRAVIWISGPKGEFQPQFTPANAVTLNAARAYVKANPDIARRLCAAFHDLSMAVKERPTDVKAAIARLFPDIDRPTVDLLFETDSLGLATKPLTKEDIVREINFVKASGVDVKTDNIDPASLMITP